MDNKELVINTLKNSAEPLKSGDIAEKSGLDKTIVDKVIKTLKDEGTVVSPKKCFYTVNK